MLPVVWEADRDSASGRGRAFVDAPDGWVRMWEAIGALLPSAFGVAISPVPIIAVILMLGTPRARSNGPAFALGWIVGLAVVSTVVVLAASGSDEPDSGPSTTVNVIKLVFGLLFLVLSVGQWRKRPRPGVEPVIPKWMQSIDQFTAVKSAGLGVLLSGVNPKNLALTVVAAATIAQAGLTAGSATVAVAVFVVISSITVAGPVLFYLIARDTAERALAPVKQYMSDHNAVIMFIVLLILGAKLVGDGIAVLAT